jgi:hypothetical protein
MLLPRLLSIFLLCGGVLACSEGPARRSVPANATIAPDTAAVRKAAQEYRVHYNVPVALDSTDFYYQAVSVVPSEPVSRLLASGSYESDYEESNIEGTCYNLLFFRKSTLEEYALLPHGRFVITEIDIDREPAVRWPFLFYTIIKNDSNADGLQDDEDASALFISDRGGRQLRQLTPDGTQLKRRQLVAKTSLLLVEVRPDTNKDHKFTPADGSYWLRLDLRDLESAPVRQPAPTLSKALRQQMIERQSR